MSIIKNDKETHVDQSNMHFWVNIPFSLKDLSADHLKRYMNHLVVH